ncbi:MAG: endolytic transglycosylase MltG [Bacteroides sp.]
MKTKGNKILISSLIAISAIICITAVLCYYFLFSHSFKLSENAYVYIDQNDNLDSVYNKVEKAVEPFSICGFKSLVRFSDYDKNIHTGRYAIRPNDDMYHVFHRISLGRQEPVDLSFNNVRTRGKLANIIGKQLMADSAEIANKLFDSVFCAGMGYSEETIVCLFIPNTYEVYWDVSVDDFFKRMQKEQKAFWTTERLNKAKEIGLTPEQVITMASIVEEETNNNTEKPMVAGLYMNRYNKRMLLQADPTVKFGLQEFGLKRILKNHLTVDSPYNTYKHIGLPPGPIRIPSIKGIESVLNYTKHNYIYMCAKEDFSGTHNFAANYPEHQANARKYWIELNKRNIK